MYHLEVKTAECCNFNALFPTCFLILPHHLSLAQASRSPDLIFFFFIIIYISFFYDSF